VAQTLWEPFPVPDGAAYASVYTSDSGHEEAVGMNCFRHQDSSAVGLCKTCFKAVCPECAADVGNGLACKNSCEEKSCNKTPCMIGP
jgi:hypothetical protein